MQFEYLIQTTSNASLDIDDIGNVAIQAFCDSGNEYYLVIKTSLGWTEIFEFGPIIRDIKELPKRVSFTYRRIEYSESKIETTIDKFLNGYCVTQAMVVGVDEAKKYIRNLADYI